MLDIHGTFIGLFDGLQWLGSELLVSSGRFNSAAVSVGNWARGRETWPSTNFEPFSSGTWDRKLTGTACYRIGTRFFADSFYQLRALRPLAEG